MQTYGQTSVAEFLGDAIVYRNLIPQDPRLPPLAEIAECVGLPAGVTPRKSEPDYARVIVHLLRKASALRGGGAGIQRLIYIGDTRLNDGTAFANLCRASGWPGLAFIGAEHAEDPASMETVAQGDAATLYLANRWSALPAFEDYCREHEFPIDAATAVVVDLDKTAVGARGRNDHVINAARVAAVRRTVGDLLGAAFDPEAFQTAYDTLNQTAFHPFTTDNQDYLAYICLVVGSGRYPLDDLIERVHDGRLASFQQFISEVDTAIKLPSDLRAIHADILDRVRQGDPTPFKAFRYNEYRETVARMGALGDNAPVESLLAQEIVVTQEVRAAALRWRDQGALLFALSDKPDEASVPTPELAAEGYVAIHQTLTHAVGG